jgi:hypothetical protein
MRPGPELAMSRAGLASMDGLLLGTGTRSIQFLVTLSGHRRVSVNGPDMTLDCHRLRCPGQVIGALLHCAGS